MRIAINTGGGDAPGLNAVIRAVTLGALAKGWEVWGIKRGYQGLLGGIPDGLVELTQDSVRGITHLGGTILGTTNRGNPLKYPRTLEDGSVVEVDRSEELVAAFEQRGLDALVAIGGDGSLRIASALAKHGLKVVGVPKTIDNDLASTTVTFGFHTAVQTTVEALGRLHSTAEAHRRVMVVEVMGRDAGWIGLFAGLGGTADVVLIPEIPYDLDIVCEKIQERYDDDGHGFAIVVVSEGAKPKDGAAVYVEGAGAGRNARLGGIAQILARQIGERTGRETRSLVLGHLQRGGEPIAYDKVLALRFGSAAVQLLEEEKFGCMVALDPPNVKAVPLSEATAHIKTVPLDGDVVQTARRLGVSFGD
ncbi:MAG: ATP-dependent 6-phosphofructokinase [Gemmatimonadetes bacterium]|nr:ATP-dependent 6-phosphofructokinase [Gemmatimonadota bacterium]